MPTIFFLEDDPDILFILTTWFARHQFTVFGFDLANELLLTLDNVVPDIMMINIKLTGSEPGTVVCRDLKLRHRYPNKIVLTSAGVFAKEVIKEALADDFIAKPFDLDDVLNKIKQHLKL